MNETPTEINHSQEEYGMETQQLNEKAYLTHLAEYEEFIGAPERRRRAVTRDDGGREEYAIISDLHIPDERVDLLQRVAEAHRGMKLVIAGDLNDMEAYGRWDVKTWGLPSLKDLLARSDAVLEYLGRYFTEIHLMFGNHDLRLPRKAAKVAGPDFYWLTQEFLMFSYEKRHGVQVVRHTVEKENRRQVPGLFYWHQIGDCLISHMETSGKPVAKGAEKAHDIFFGLQNEMNLNPFRVLLHAHTHKQGYFRHPLTQVHCYEIGCLCDIPAYHLLDPKYGPLRHGYFKLVQYGGVTSINESRLVCLDEP